MTPNSFAPGAPGIPPRWTSSAKSGVGTSLSLSSHVWFTLSHGIVDEIYYPRLDQACTRDLGLIVTDGKDFFSEEKRNTSSELSYITEFVPAYRVINTDLQGRYRIEKEIFADPNRDVILQRIHFTPLKGRLSDYRLYVLLAPHIGNRGYGNTAWVGGYKGDGMLMASQGAITLALAGSAPWLKRSAGFVGVSDGWQDLSEHFQMTWEYERAENGNVALTGEIDLQRAAPSGSGCSFILALGFGRNDAEAGQRVRAALYTGFDKNLENYTRGWQAWQNSLANLNPVNRPKSTQPQLDLYHVSTTVMRIHESKSFPGGLIASLSIPWGFAKGDDDLGGYHLVWPRDLVEMAGGLLAAGAFEDTRRVLEYLRVTQEADGHWGQNMWLDGMPYWTGSQTDETALPILLVDLASRQKALPGDALQAFWPMVRSAAGFIVRTGPVTQEDRWEEDGGYSPFTLAAEIAALLAAADLAERCGEARISGYLRLTADTWNDSLERWIYVTGTDLTKEYGVEGYYVRIAPPEVAEAASPILGFVPIKNRPPGQSQEPAACIVSPDALALVRFGLRAPDDSRILNTVKVIDALLKVDAPTGPAWHRYNDDGYGEHADGSPFDGTGIGRAWPLLTGERAHYELIAGHADRAQALAAAMESFANQG
jgi:glucoamylase